LTSGYAHTELRNAAASGIASNPASHSANTGSVRLRYDFRSG
jgi:hypothetical protein